MRSSSARRPIRSTSSPPMSSTPAPSASPIRRLPHRSRPSTTTSKAAGACCASSRRFPAGTIRPPMWCGGSRSRPPTMSRCRSRCSTARTSGSMARRRCFWKAMAPIRMRSRRRSIRTCFRSSIAGSSMRLRTFAAGWRRASAGATPGGSRTRSTRSETSSRSPSISAGPATPRLDGSSRAAIPPAAC